MDDATRQRMIEEREELITVLAALVRRANFGVEDSAECGAAEDLLRRLGVDPHASKVQGHPDTSWLTSPSGEVE